MNTIGLRIYPLLKSKGMSLGTLSEVSGIAKTTLHRYLNGDESKVTLSKINEIASALNVSPEYLLGWSDSRESRMAAILKDIIEETGSPLDDVMNDIPRFNPELANKQDFTVVKQVYNDKFGDYDPYSRVAKIAKITNMLMDTDTITLDFIIQFLIAGKKKEETL